jgi:hypothetical protein
MRSLIVVLVLVLTIVSFAPVFAQDGQDLYDVRVGLNCVTFDEILVAYGPWIESNEVVVLDAREEAMQNEPLLIQLTLYAEKNQANFDELVAFFSDPAADVINIPAGEVWVVENWLGEEVLPPAATPVVDFTSDHNGCELWQSGYEISLTPRYYTDDGIEQLFENPTAKCELSFSEAVSAYSETWGVEVNNFNVSVGPEFVAFAIYNEDGLIIEAAWQIYLIDQDGCLIQ